MMIKISKSHKNDYMINTIFVKYNIEIYINICVRRMDAPSTITTPLACKIPFLWVSKKRIGLSGLPEKLQNSICITYHFLIVAPVIYLEYCRCIYMNMIVILW